MLTDVAIALVSRVAESHKRGRLHKQHVGEQVPRMRVGHKLASPVCGKPDSMQAMLMSFGVTSSAEAVTHDDDAGNQLHFLSVPLHSTDDLVIIDANPHQRDTVLTQTIWLNFAHQGPSSEKKPPPRLEQPGPLRAEKR